MQPSANDLQYLPCSVITLLVASTVHFPAIGTLYAIAPYLPFNVCQVVVGITVPLPRFGAFGANT